jgi:hypothetical protein
MLSIVAQAFVDLQQAGHKADYDIGEPFQGLDADLLSINSTTDN